MQNSPGWLRLLAFTAGVTVLSGAPTPDWSARTWQADDGLPDNRITGLVQLPAGDLWIATRSGLARFNGLGFEVFNMDTIKGLTGNGARAMFGDARGNLWVGAYRDALVRLSRDASQVITAESGLPAGQLTGLAEATDGTVWLSIGSRVGRMVGGKFQELALPVGPTPPTRATLARDSQGNVWCFSNGHLGLIQSAAFVPRAALDYREGALGSAKAGGIWVCADANLYRMQDGMDPVKMFNLPAGARPLVVLEDREGAVWVGTMAHGLFRCDQGRVVPINVAAPQVGYLLEDREGNIWAGTNGGGLHRLRPSALELMGEPAGLPSASMASVCQDLNGQYWAATASGHLVRGDGKHWSMVPLGPLWPGGSAACVATDRQGRLWVGTRGQGLFEINLGAGTVRNWLQKDGLLTNSIRCLFVAADDSLWFSSNTPTSVGQIKANTLRLRTLPGPARNVRTITQDAAGTIWAGTSDGQVLKAAGDQMVPDPDLSMIENSSVRCLHATPDGSLWIGYADKGLGHFKNGRYARLTTTQGLMDDSVWQLTSDQAGFLWLASARGLYRLPLLEAVAVAEGRQARLRPRLYGRAEGLPNPHPHYDNSPAVSQGRDGTILLATSLGLLALHPEALRDNPLAPPVAIDRVTVDDQVVAVRDSRFPLRLNPGPALADAGAAGSRLELPPEHRRLTIDYYALSFSAPENVRYRYRLEGSGDDWSEPVTERTARYSQLPAGEYQFRVMGSNDAGVWNEKGTTLAVIVHPFYWQTWWFRLGALGAFTGVVTAVVRWISFRRLQTKLRLAEQQAALFQERTRIARDIHDDLGGSLAHIKLISEIALQERDLPENVGQQVRQITTTTQQVLKSLDETIWAINPGNDTLPHLVSYLGQYTVEFLRAAGIACEVDLPDAPPEWALTPETRHHVFLAAKEALTNVVRHSGARKVWLKTSLRSRTLHVAIEDDGCGFETGPVDAHADGIRNMRQRMEAAGGLFRIESKAGAGTRIHLEIVLQPPA